MLEMVIHDALEIVASARPGTTPGTSLTSEACTAIQRPSLGLPVRLKWLMGRLPVYICWILKRQDKTK